MFGSTHLFPRKFLYLFLTAAILPTAPSVQAQAFEKELNISAKALLTIKNRSGRVSVIASDNEKDKPTLKATSTTGTVESTDVVVSGNEIDVRERPYRIDVTVRVPKRARVKIESESGMVDVIGDFATA